LRLLHTSASAPSQSGEQSLQNKQGTAKTNRLISASQSRQGGYIMSNYKNYQLHSAFQPIISVAHRRAVGYEGLIRAETSDKVSHSPLNLFLEPTTNAEHLSLDRLCRSLHIQNFSQQETSNEWLFINLNSQCLATEKPDPGFMNSLFSITGIAPRRIVIEILESEIYDRVYLQELITHFRSLGCLIAIDDFGAGHSNFDRIWELEPDIVKIDRSLIQRAAVNVRIERILTGIVSLIHEAGSLVIIEGVETEKEALTAIRANTDMIQGFYFAKPNKLISPDNTLDQTFNTLLKLQKRQKNLSTCDLNNNFTQFEKLFKNTLNDFSLNHSIEASAEIIFKEPRAIRCFLLSEAGYQIGSSIHSPKFRTQIAPHFLPLLSGNNANWAHKNYHYRAIHQFNQIQISRPYLSVAGSHLCITVSQAVSLNNKIFVFCCDLEWLDD